MKRFTLLLIAGLCLTGAAPACINSYEEELEDRLAGYDRSMLDADIRRLEAAQQTRPGLETANDLAVAHLLAGHYDTAIVMFRELEKAHPGAPLTAPNLGTALELAGRDAEALHWIREGIRRHPDDHQGTEWLHVKILEAKLALATDPDWLTTHSVLGLDFGSGAMPAMPAHLPVDHDGRTRTLEETAAALRYQMAERLRFVAPPDPVVGDLHFSWGDIAVLNRGNDESDFKNAPSYYEAALLFGTPKAALVKRRGPYADAHRVTRQPWFWTLPGGAVGVAALAWRWQRRRRVAPAQP